MSMRSAADAIQAAALAAIAVVLPIHLLLFYPLIWWLLWPRWDRAGSAGRAVPWAVTGVIVLAAWLAPVKPFDRIKSRPVAIPKVEMTLQELSEPLEHGLVKPDAYYSLAVPEGMEGRVIRFESLKPTLGEFIDAIEAQAPMRHRFASCLDGWSILWGLEYLGHLMFLPRPVAITRR